METVRCKVVDAKGEMKKLVGGLRRDTFGSCVSIRHNVDQYLLTVGSRLEELFDREAKALQPVVHGSLHYAGGGVQKLIADAPEVVDRSLSLIDEHPKRGESAKLKFFSAHFSNRERGQKRARVASDSGVRL